MRASARPTSITGTQMITGYAPPTTQSERNFNGVSRTAETNSVRAPSSASAGVTASDPIPSASAAHGGRKSSGSITRNATPYTSRMMKTSGWSVAQISMPSAMRITRADRDLPPQLAPSVGDRPGAAGDEAEPDAGGQGEQESRAVIGEGDELGGLDRRDRR